MCLQLQYIGILCPNDTHALINPSIILLYQMILFPNFVNDKLGSEVSIPFGQCAWKRTYTIHLIFKT